MTYLPEQIPFTVAHDYFTQRGGAERVAALIIEQLNPRRVVTALYTPETTFSLPAQVPIETSPLQKFKYFRKHPRRSVALLPLAWRMFKPVGSGVVVCSSSGWAHSIRARPNVLKIVYCHNPARWLYQPNDFYAGHSALLTWVAKAASVFFRKWDTAAAATADVYIANSRSVATRIHAAYGKVPIVVNPPISLQPDGHQCEVPNLRDGYFLSVSRRRGYKNTRNLIDAFAAVPDERLVVVGTQRHGPERNNVTYLPRVTDSELRWLYAHSKALISVSFEDFGLTPLEANAFGKPALVLRAGGFLDSIEEHVTGEFIEDVTADAIRRAIKRFPLEWDRSRIYLHAEQFSPEKFVEELVAIVKRHPKYVSAVLQTGLA